MAAEKVGENGKVIAIEPEPCNYRQLLKNIKLNNFKNVIIRNIALSDHKGTEQLYIHFLAGKHSLFIKNGTISSIEVQVTTLDQLIEELGLNQIDVIKIDTEGAEMSILKGAERTLKANPNIKIIVASYHYPSERKEITLFLKERGFKPKIFQGGIVITI